VVFELGMHEPVRRRRELELSLHRALEQDEFVLWYQPIVDLASREVRAVEALVRWREPDGTLVPPGDFIPLAEETGLMVPLGRWVLMEACREAAGWRSRPGGADLTVSVNISARQLRDPGLVDDVQAALCGAGLPPDALCLELTESALIADTDAVHDRLRQLKGLGVLLAIDDFGTGYSSLGYLRRLPVDELKVDKTFVDDLASTATAASLAQVIVTLAQTLGMRAVAEGVESEAQAATLRDIGCPQAQGYLFHRPMPAEELGRLLPLGLPHPATA
jgi:EAL domain-containing protein (putative c-di-GMP-specific phosphodiesterase class I)